jgi:transposase
MPLKLPRPKTCPCCGRKLTAVSQKVRIFGRRYPNRTTTVFDRHLQACFSCGVVVRLNRMPQTFTRET